MKSDNPDLQYALSKTREENDYLSNVNESLREERDRLNSSCLLTSQVELNKQQKEIEISEIFQEQIDELKENLERKEYLLQLSEQRSAAFEKLLLNLSGTDPQVHEKIKQQNIILKDRKISNVAAENVGLREANEFLTEQNRQMRE
jgi:rRNA maturation endonuclease Nob1